MTNETSRYRWPVPAWSADWQQWQSIFRDLATNIDATVFSAVDGNRLMFESLPDASIVSNGPGYDLSMDGPLVIRSRTHSVSISVPVGATALTAGSILALSITPGAVGSQSITWQTYSGGIGSSPDIVPFGYVDTSYNITWWNGTRLLAGAAASQLFGSSGGGGGTPGGTDGQIQYNDDGALGGSELYFDDVGGKIGFRNPSPYFDIDVANAVGAGASIAVRTYSDTMSASLLLGRARGTLAAPEAVETGDFIGALNFIGAYGSGATDIVQGAAIVAEAAEGFTSGAAGTNLGIFTTKYGEPAAGRTATFTANGDLDMWNGGIRLHGYNGTELAGVIEWDGSNFRGYTGSAWVNLDSSTSGGDVSKVGTPVDNQVGVWTGDGTIEGTTGLTFDGSELAVDANITTTGTVDGIDVGVDVAANTAARHAAITLAASATTGGLDLTIQEIGFQAASQGPLVTLSDVSIGNPPGGAVNQTLWAGDTWFGMNGDDGKIVRWDGGTDWTEIQNTLDPTGDTCHRGVVFDGEIWMGARYNPTIGVSSYNPDTNTWTSRDSSVRNIVDICTYGSTVAILTGANGDGPVYYWAGGTAWTSLGSPGFWTEQIIEADSGLYLKRYGSNTIYKHDGGTGWGSIGSPAGVTTLYRMGVWKGILIASCNDASGSAFYKYESSTWTKLGGAIEGAAAYFVTFGVDSNDVLYAAIWNSSWVDWHKYDEGTNSWSELLRSTTISYGHIGEFNPNDEFGWGAWNGSVYVFQDAGYHNPTSGYLTGADWQTFNNKADALAGVDGELITWDSDGNPALVAAGASGQVLTSNGAGAAPTFQAGGSGGLTWQRVTASTVATSGNGYLVDAASNSVSISLPSSPSIGDVVAIQVYDAAYTVLVNRNTNNIEGATFSPALGKGDSATFVYAEATEGWVRVGAAGGTIHATVSSTLTTLDTFTDSVNGAAQYMYYIANAGTNFRSGTIRIHWDGINNLIEKDETSVTSIGDTSDFVFTADIDTGMVRLRGDADNSYSVRLVKTMI